MSVTYKAKLNKNNHKNKSGRYSIFIRVTLERKSKYINLNEKIDGKFWSEKENRWVSENYPFAFELNSLIRKKIDFLREFEYRQKLFGNTVSLESIVEYYFKKVHPNVFNEYVSEFIRTVDGKSPNTIKKYKTFEKFLDEYNTQINFSQLNETFFKSFAIWLQKKGMMGVTVIKYFDPFKVIVRQAVKDGYLEKNPFDNVNLGIKPTKRKRVYLEVEEITLLKNAKIPKDQSHLEETRDHWLFCFYASFYYSDLRGLKWEVVKKSKSGETLVADRFKNNNAYIAPVHKFPGALKILNKQRGKDPVYVFPNAISETKYNLKLKDLAKLAGINKNLMNKTARHSSIQFWIAQGLEVSHTGSIAGHTKESTTEVYFDLTEKDINEKVAKFDFSKIDI